MCVRTRNKQLCDTSMRLLLSALMLSGAGDGIAEVIHHTSMEDDEFYDAEEGPDTPTGLRSPSQRRSSGTGSALQGSGGSFGALSATSGGGLHRSTSEPMTGGQGGAGAGAGGTELVRLTFVRHNPLSSRWVL